MKFKEPDQDQTLKTGFELEIYHFIGEIYGG
jgi:hypothetical protein